MDSCPYGNSYHDDAYHSQVPREKAAQSNLISRGDPFCDDDIKSHRKEQYPIENAQKPQGALDGVGHLLRQSLANDSNAGNDPAGLCSERSLQARGRKG